MEQLALFALPMAENEDLEDDSTSGDKEDSPDSASVQVDDDDDDDNDGENSALHDDTADNNPNLDDNVFVRPKVQLDPLVNGRVELMRREDFTPTSGGACLLMLIEDQFKTRDCPCFKYSPQRRSSKICTCGHPWAYHEGERDDLSNPEDSDEQRPLNAESSQPPSPVAVESKEEHPTQPEDSFFLAESKSRILQYSELSTFQDMVDDPRLSDIFRPEHMRLLSDFLAEDTTEYEILLRKCYDVLEQKGSGAIESQMARAEIEGISMTIGARLCLRRQELDHVQGKQKVVEQGGQRSVSESFIEVPTDQHRPLIGPSGQTHDKSPGAGKSTVGGLSSISGTTDAQLLGAASVKAGLAQMLADSKNANLEFETLASDQRAHIDTKKSDQEVQHQIERLQEDLNLLSEDIQKLGMNEEEIELVLNKDHQVEDEDVLLERELARVQFNREEGERAARLQHEKFAEVIMQGNARLAATNMTIESAIASGSGSADDRVSASEEKESIKPELATTLRDQEKGGPEVETSLKKTRSAIAQITQEAVDSSILTSLAAEQNTQAMEKAVAEAQQSREVADAIKKRAW